MLKNGTTFKGFWSFDGPNPVLDLSGGVLQSAALVGSQRVQVFSTSTPRTIDSPLYCAGGGYIAGTFDVIGALYANGGVYDSAGNQLLTTRQTGTIAAADSYTVSSTYSTDVSGLKNTIVLLVNAYNNLRGKLVAHGLIS
jgi:hypothetical protein